MKTILFLVAVFSILIGCQSKPKQQDVASEATTVPDSASSLAKRPGPDAPRSAADRLVRALYFEHQKTDNPFRTTTDRALVEQFFTKETAAQIWNSKPAVKKDLLFNAPDNKIKKAWVEPAAVGGSRAIVYTTFEENGSKKEIKLEWPLAYQRNNVSRWIDVDRTAQQVEQAKGIIFKIRVDNTIKACSFATPNRKRGRNRSL